MISDGLAQPLIMSLVGGGFIAAALHAALPTHWLPFVLVGRAQSWDARRVALAVVLAASAHIIVTAAFGLLITLAGVALDRWVHGVLPYLSAAFLFLFGGFYLVRYWHKRKEPDCQGCVLDTPKVSDKAALLGLIGVLASSPGEVLLPLYLSSASQGAGVFILMSLAFWLGTMAGMLILILLAWAGYSVFRLERWARYEGIVLGLSLIALGVLMALHIF